MNYINICNEMNQLNHYTALASSSQIIDELKGCMEHKADIILENMYGSTVWGYLKNRYNKPMCNQRIILLKAAKDTCSGREYFEIVAHTYTDEKGYYMMEVYIEEGVNLSVIVDTQDIQGEEITKRSTDIPECTDRTTMDESDKECTKNKGEWLPRRIESYRTCTNYVKFYGNN